MIPSRHMHRRDVDEAWWCFGRLSDHSSWSGLLELVRVQVLRRPRAGSGVVEMAWPSAEPWLARGFFMLVVGLLLTPSILGRHHCPHRNPLAWLRREMSDVGLRTSFGVLWRFSKSRYYDSNMGG